MIHTIRLSMSTFSRRQAALHADSFGFTPDEIQKLIESPVQERAMIHKSLTMMCQGISSIVMCRTPIDNYSRFIFSLYLRIEPQRLLEGKRTIGLYHPSEENNRRLITAFRKGMACILKEPITPELYDLYSWKCNRIDYTANLEFPTSKEADLFLLLSHRTSRQIRRKQKKIKKCKESLQSSAEGNKSSKLIFYKKAKQIDETYTSISMDEREELKRDAESIIRFEIQCRKGKVYTLKQHYGFSDTCIMNFLNPDISMELLEKCYIQMVGEGDFFSLYHARKKIMNSSYREKEKEKLFNTIRLIAQSRGVIKGLLNFTHGDRIKNTEIIVKGTKTTFNKRLKELSQIGVNPYPIPKDWKITYLQNPIDQIRRTSHPE